MNLSEAMSLSRLGGVIALAATLVGCTPSVADHWDDPGAHVVDGHWVGEEHLCVDPPESVWDWCAAEVAYAESALGINAADVVRAATSGLLRQWVTADGERHVLAYAALTMPAFVVFTLKDGSRRALGVFCNFHDPGNPKPDTCQTFLGDMYRVHGPGPSPYSEQSSDRQARAARSMEAISTPARKRSSEQSDLSKPHPKPHRETAGLVGPF